MLAGLAALIRHLAVRGDDGVAYGAFCLAFQGAGDVAAEGRQAVCYGAILGGC